MKIFRRCTSFNVFHLYLYVLSNPNSNCSRFLDLLCKKQLSRMLKILETNAQKDNVWLFTFKNNQSVQEKLIKGQFYNRNKDCRRPNWFIFKTSWNIHCIDWTLNGQIIVLLLLFPNFVLLKDDTLNTY